MMHMRQRQKAFRELQEGEYGKTKLRFHVVFALACIALIVAAPLAVEDERKAVSVSAQEQQTRAQREAMQVEAHRKAVFDERRQAWERQKTHSAAENVADR